MRWAATFIGLATCLLASPAWAEGWEPDTHRSGAGIELYPWSSDLGFHTALIGFANIGVTEDFYIDVQFPATFGIDGAPGDVERGGIGNPTAIFRFAPTMGIVRWWLGGGVGAPVNAVEDSDWRRQTAYAAQAMAFYQSYLWVPEYFPLLATGGVDIRVASFLSLQFSGEPMVFVNVDTAPLRDRVEFALQNRFGLEFRNEATGLGGGGHLKLFFIPTSDQDPFVFSRDNAQASVEAFFAWTHDVFFLRFGVLFAIDEPLGPPFADGSVLSQHATFGGQW